MLSTAARSSAAWGIVEATAPAPGGSTRRAGWRRPRLPRRSRGPGPAAPGWGRAPRPSSAADVDPDGLACFDRGSGIGDLADDRVARRTRETLRVHDQTQPFQLRRGLRGWHLENVRHREPAGTPRNDDGHGATLPDRGLGRRLLADHAVQLDRR